MKNIFKFLVLLPFFVTFSCSDAYEIEQANELLFDDAFQNINDIESGFNGAFISYSPDRDVLQFNDLFTDNLRAGAFNNGQGSQVYNFLIQPNSDIAEGIWTNRYATINRINRVLLAYDKLYSTFSTTDKQFADHLKGNLLALRALCHFDLFQYYTVDYRNLNSPSVIKMDFVPKQFSDVFPRNNVQEILSFIKSDITTALPLINNTPTNTKIGPYNTVAHLRVSAVNFLRCKVALIEGDYPTAETLATSLAASNAMSNAAVYPQIFTDESAGETIFRLNRLPGNFGAASLFFFNSAGGLPTDPFLQVSKQLFESYASNDIRRNVVVRNVDLNSDRYWVNKYRGSTNGPTLSHIKIYRSSELRLILAECFARSGNFPGAALQLKALRDIRHTSPTTLSTFVNLNAALTEILDERRKEFCFEGYRFLDLKRLGKEINLGINRLPVDAATFSAPTSLSSSDYRLTLPIPANEIFSNPTIVQNPNY
jgi:hypothetical protein